MALNFPGSPTDGQTYVAPNGTTYVYDATNTLWRVQGGDGDNVVFVSATAPVAPTQGKMWWNSVTGAMYIWYIDVDGGQWVPAAATGPAIIAPDQDLSVSSLVASGDVQTASVNGGHAGPSNIIINGTMAVAQRATTGSGINTNGYHTIDRMRLSSTSLSTAQFTHEQVTDAPAGFSHSLKLTTTTAEGSVGAQDSYRPLQYNIEGQDLQHLEYGTANAKSLTLSFHVKSSVTGTYNVAFYRDDSPQRQITSTYTVNSADTWEYKTITIPGDTGAAIASDNANRLSIYWHAGAGSDYTSTDSTSWGDYIGSGFAYGTAVNLQNVLNATWQITGVQLTATDTAVAFQHEDYATTLRKCQRYYFRTGGNSYGTSGVGGNTNVAFPFLFPTTMREAPTMTRENSSTGPSFTDVSSTGVSLQPNTLDYFSGRWNADAEL